MFRSTILSPSHYAGKWEIPSEDQRNDLKVVNELGHAYGLAGDGPVREAQLLLLLERFHPYLMKYLRMIVRGTLPESNTRYGKESEEMLRTLAPRGSAPGRATAESTCKMLHLAFKGATTEEIYDTLAFCFMNAARRYDPHYARKTSQVCEVITGFEKSEFSIGQLEDGVDFDCGRILRALARKGFLSGVVTRKKVTGYTLGPSWPPPAAFFKSGPIGFTYMVQMWFRYYLKDHVIRQMGELESGDNVLGLLHHTADEGSYKNDVSEDAIMPHAEGNSVSDTGHFRFMADRTLMEAQFDVSEIDYDWVAGTSDRLFRDLTCQQRLILYLYYRDELTFKEIGRSLGVDERETSVRLEEILNLVRDLAGIPAVAVVLDAQQVEPK